MSAKEIILQRLKALGIPHACHEHAPAAAMADCLALPFAKADVVFCKNILLCNRQQTEFYLYVTLPQRPFRTAEISKLLGTSRLSFAPAEALPRLLRLEPGSLSPLGLWFDEEKRIRLVFDEGVRQAGRIAFHPCDNSATVVFEQPVFWRRVVPELGHGAVYIQPQAGMGQAQTEPA